MPREFAFAYSVVGTLVATGLLYPAFSVLPIQIVPVLAMALGFVSVFGDAPRLRGVRPGPRVDETRHVTVVIASLPSLRTQRSNLPAGAHHSGDCFAALAMTGALRAR
jgi:hypothetical protein